LALAEIYDSGTHSDAARIGGAGLQIMREVVPFIAKGADGILNGKAPRAFQRPSAPGVPADLEEGPIPAIDGIVC
jgi:hypothetical protein